MQATVDGFVSLCLFVSLAMIENAFVPLFTRDLGRLKNEIDQYAQEATLWQVKPGISNSAGNLCLHLVGNLNAYIGVGLAGSDYKRNRDLEFASKNVPKATLLNMVSETAVVVEKGLRTLSVDDMEKSFPIVIWDKPTSMEYTLLQLLGHLNYHLGQINYHRRILQG